MSRANLGPARLTWLSFSDAETTHARALIAALGTEGVVDELGFAPLSSAFAERLYPATTTVMTRARYLFFLPAIFRHIEGCSGGIDAESLARSLQDELRKILATTEGEGKGVIGFDSGEKLIRLPSNVYWAALRDLGIFTGTCSERAYLEQVTARSRERKTAKDDDRERLQGAGDSSWDPAFRTARLDNGGAFSADTDFQLTPQEAFELRKRLAALDEARGTGPSLLSHLIASPERWPGHLAWPWSANALPPRLAEVTRHGRALSHCARGAILQYHHMLTRKRIETNLAVSDTVDLRALFGRWWNERTEHGVIGWDLNAFANLPLLRNVRRLHEDLHFIGEWTTIVNRSRSANEVLDNQRAYELIRRREKLKRPRKARLENQRFLADWRSRSTSAAYEGPYELDYRHRIGLVFARDIAGALRRGTA